MVIVFDMDDTLFDEIDFVRSGFAEIARYLTLPESFDFMLSCFEAEGSGTIFDRLIRRFDLDVPLAKLIEIYRFHHPDIHLDDESKHLLEYVKHLPTALITDGHYLMQQNKYRVLGLDTLIDYPIFSDFYHTNKPDPMLFEKVMQRFPNTRYVYIADNPKKDFIAPAALGWHSVRYVNPRGIYHHLEDDPNAVRAVSKLDIIQHLEQWIHE